MEKITQNIVIENARILFRNFEGRGDRFNREGNRNFNVVIPSIEMAEELLSDGWNVKFLQPRDEGDESTPIMEVGVSFKVAPPKIFMVTRHNKTLMDEKTIESLDYAEIANVDLVIRPYNWEVNGKCGVKAYVKTMYVTIEEDEFADKYDF